MQEGYKWIRYFFFAQSILPSRNVGIWNNYYALWSMSPIFVFYILAPFVYWLIQKKKTSSYLLLMGGILLSYFSRCFALFLSNNSRVYELSYVFLADHHPASLLYQFFAGCIAYVYLFEKKSMKIVGGYSLMLLAIFLINFEEEYLFTLLFLLLIICFYYRAIQFKLPWVNTVIRTLDEYSFSIY